MNLKIDAGLYCLGNFSERYVPGGYHKKDNFKRKIESIGKIKGIIGVFSAYPSDELKNADNYLNILTYNNLKVSNLSVINFDNKKWKYGAFSYNKKNVRKQTLEIFKEGIEIAKYLKAHSVLLWPAHDGFDYPFQLNYEYAWENLIELIREISEYDKDVKIAVEPKPKDPRQNHFIRDTGKLLYLLNRINLENVGGALDTGHSICAGENISESLSILSKSNKLFQIHLNENYRDADPDLMFGSINFWEDLEFFYYLNQTDYDGWLSIDIVSPRDNPVNMLNETVKLIEIYDEKSRELIKNKEIINKNLHNQQYVKNIKLIREILF